LGEAVALFHSLQQATHALHEVTVERDRLREQHRRLVDEFRFVREQLLRHVEAA